MKPAALRERSADPLAGALAPIHRQLAVVSDHMLGELQDPVAKKVVYLITAGGKRLRPALVLLAGAAGGSKNERGLIAAASAVELIHTATLIHDDIIDQSRLRRSQPSFHHRWGTERALLMGDYLYATAFSMLAGLREPYVMRVMAEVCQQLCRGELREVEARFRLNLKESEYFAIIEDKTASLVGGCCRSGARLGGADEPTTERLGIFGVKFGLAFQIIDDCLDLTGDLRQLGKPVLSDLDKGALSLPMIYLTQQLSARERNRLFAPVKERSADPAWLAQIAQAARAAGTIEQAQARAQALIQEALEAVAGIPMNGFAGAYQRLADYAISRSS